jgi:hypothetical protein
VSKPKRPGESARASVCGGSAVEVSPKVDGCDKELLRAAHIAESGVKLLDDYGLSYADTCADGWACNSHRVAQVWQDLQGLWFLQGQCRQ